MCPKCLIDQLVGVLQIYIDNDQANHFYSAREITALSLIKEAKAMQHSHDEMIPIEQAAEVAMNHGHE